MFVFYWVLVCSQNMKSKNLMSKNRSQIPANYLTSIFLGTLHSPFWKHVEEISKKKNELNCNQQDVWIYLL